MNAKIVRPVSDFDQRDSTRSDESIAIFLLLLDSVSIRVSSSYSAARSLAPQALQVLQATEHFDGVPPSIPSVAILFLLLVHLLQVLQKPVLVQNYLLHFIFVKAVGLVHLRTSLSVVMPPLLILRVLTRVIVCPAALVRRLGESVGAKRVV